MEEGPASRGLSRPRAALTLSSLADCKRERLAWCSLRAAMKVGLPGLHAPRVRVRLDGGRVCDSARAAVATKLPNAWGSHRVGGGERSSPRRAWGRRAIRALDGNHELSSGVAFALVSESLGNLAQLVAPIDDRRDLSGLDELPQDNQVVPRMPCNEDAHPLSHER